MSPHLAAKLLKQASPLLHPDSAIQSDSDDDMVYSPYYPSHRRSSSASKRRRSNQLSHEVRADIVARVLDPAYSGRREYSSRVFVDNNGDEHDPDYQLFPTQLTRHRRSTSSGLPRRMSSDDDLCHDDDAESEAEWTRSRATSPYSSSAATTPSPPANPVSLFGDDEWDEKEWTREVVVPVTQSKRRKPKTCSRPVSAPVPEPVSQSPIVSDESRHSSVELVREDTIDTTPEAPSRSYVIRRQWAAFTLHTQLSAHRIARRARQAVSVGT